MTIENGVRIENVQTLAVFLAQLTREGITFKVETVSESVYIVHFTGGY